MDKFIELSQDEAMQLRNQLLAMGTGLYKVRVFVGDDCAKFKVNEGIWSPPMGKAVHCQ